MAFTGGADQKGRLEVTPSLKTNHFTPFKGGIRSFFSALLGIKWEKRLGIKLFETAPLPASCGPFDVARRPNGTY